MLTDEEKQKITTATKALMRGEYQHLVQWWELVSCSPIFMAYAAEYNSAVSPCVTDTIAAAQQAAPGDTMVAARAHFLADSLIIAQNMHRYSDDAIRNHRDAAARLETLLTELATTIDESTDDTPERHLWAEVTNMLAYHEWKGSGKKSEERNHDLIIERFKSARDAGSVLAAVNLAYYYYLQKDYTTAREYVEHELAAEQPATFLMLSNMYLDGLGCSVDRVAATDCLDQYLVLKPPSERDVTTPRASLVIYADKFAMKKTRGECELESRYKMDFSPAEQQRLIVRLVGRLVAGEEVTCYAKDWLKKNKGMVVTHLCSGDDAAIKLATAVAPNSLLNKLIQSFGSKSTGSGLFSGSESYVDILQRTLKVMQSSAATATAQPVADVEMVTVLSSASYTDENAAAAGVGERGVSAAGLRHRSSTGGAA